MQHTTRLRIALFLNILALTLLVLAVVGMFRSPRPGWSRDLIIPALVLILSSRALRRTTRNRAGTP